MWEAVRSGEQVVPLERCYVFTATVAVDELPYAHLAARLRDDPRHDSYATSVVRFAARVLQMVGIARQAATAQERATRATLLRELLAVEAPDATLLERLSVFGFDEDANVRVLVGRAADEEGAQRTVAAVFARRHTPSLVDAAGNEVVALWATTEGDRDDLEELPLTALGIGLPVVARDGVQRALREARVALLRAEREGSRVVSFEDLGFADLLLSYLPAERLGAATKVLAPLRDDRPDLLETLAVYLDHDCNVVTSARALHLHANSLRYRLSMIEKILGRSLRSLETLLELTLALRIEAALGEPGRTVARSRT
jgi:DNA-binding PucR family transcriptional regulator